MSNMSELKIVIGCYICNKVFNVEDCTEVTLENDSRSYYLCPNCLRDVLWEVRPHITEVIERLRKFERNPSER